MKAQEQLERAIESFVLDMQSLIRRAAEEQLQAILSRDGGTSSKRGSTTASKAVVQAEPAGRIRRSADQLAAVQEKIVKLLGAKPKLTSEEIQTELGLSKKDIQLPLQLLRDEKRINAKGERRAMRYFVGAGKPGVVRRKAE